LKKSSILAIFKLLDSWRGIINSLNFEFSVWFLSKIGERYVIWISRSAPFPRELNWKYLKNLQELLDKFFERFINNRLLNLNLMRKDVLEASFGIQFSKLDKSIF